MVATLRRPLTVAVLGTFAALSWVPTAFGQTGLPPVPVPVLPADPAPPIIGRPQPLPGPAGPPTQLPNATVITPPIGSPPPPLTPPPPSAPPLYAPHDPGPNGWGPYSGPSPDPMFILNAELQVLVPHIRNQLTDTVNLPDGSAVTVAPPGASVRATVSPEFEIGYRLPECLGQFTLGFRFLASDGSTTLNDGLSSNVKTRLDMNIVDFDYSSAYYSPIPRWDMKWWLGVRYATAFWDNHQTNAFTDITSSNYFNGAGPHAALEVQRHIGPLPAFAVFAKLDGAVLIGPIRQRFRQTQFDPFGNPEEGETDERLTQSVPMIDVRVGLSYTPPQLEHLKFSVGYQFEQWWNLGQLGDSRGEVSSNGGFLRAEWDF